MEDIRNTPPPVPQDPPATPSGKRLDRWCNALTLVGLLAVIGTGGYAIFRDRRPAAQEPAAPAALPAPPAPEELPAEEPLTELDIHAAPAPEPHVAPPADTLAADSFAIQALDSLADRMRHTADSLSRSAPPVRDTLRHGHDTLRPAGNAGAAPKPKRAPAKPRPAARKADAADRPA